MSILDRLRAALAAFKGDQTIAGDGAPGLALRAGSVKPVGGWTRWSKWGVGAAALISLNIALQPLSARKPAAPTGTKPKFAERADLRLSVPRVPEEAGQEPPLTIGEFMEALKKEVPEPLQKAFVKEFTAQPELKAKYEDAMKSGRGKNAPAPPFVRDVMKTPSFEKVMGKVKAQFGQLSGGGGGGGTAASFSAGPGGPGGSAAGAGKPTFQSAFDQAMKSPAVSSVMRSAIDPKAKSGKRSVQAGRGPGGGSGSLGSAIGRDTLALAGGGARGPNASSPGAAGSGTSGPAYGASPQPGGSGQPTSMAPVPGVGNAIDAFGPQGSGSGGAGEGGPEMGGGQQTPPGSQGSGGAQAPAPQPDPFAYADDGYWKRVFDRLTNRKVTADAGDVLRCWAACDTLADEGLTGETEEYRQKKVADCKSRCPIPPECVFCPPDTNDCPGLRDGNFHEKYANKSCREMHTLECIDQVAGVSAPRDCSSIRECGWWDDVKNFPLIRFIVAPVIGAIITLHTLVANGVAWLFGAEWKWGWMGGWWHYVGNGPDCVDY